MAFGRRTKSKKGCCKKMPMHRTGNTMFHIVKHSFTKTAMGKGRR